MKRRFRINQFVREFSNNGQLGGMLLLLATAFSLLLTNTGIGHSYQHFWEKTIGSGSLSLSIEHWINDGLMVVFFFLVGIEIKREIQHGELSDFRQALLPVVAALGGLTVPALIYLALNHGTEASSGWAIPTSTDIAFSLAVLMLLGNRVPLGLKIFLTALAIIDDLGAIVIIALAYSQEVELWYLVGAAGLLGLLVVVNRYRSTNLYIHWLVGVCLWYFILQSGIHATLAGVLLALVIPIRFIPSLEKRLHTPVNYFILPLFALANTAIMITSHSFHSLTQPLELGIILGLTLGKPIGITLASFVLIRLGLARLPLHTSWLQLIGAGIVAGIGFTMSMFMANLSFQEVSLINDAKLSIIIASVLAGLAGYVWLRIVESRNRRQDFS